MKNSRGLSTCSINLICLLGLITLIPLGHTAQIGKVLTQEDKTIVDLDTVNEIIETVNNQFDLYFDEQDVKVVYGEIYIDETESVDGDIILVNTTGKIHGTINGSILVFGGNLTVTGTINGNLVGKKGTVALTNTAVVRDKLIRCGADISVSSATRIGEDTSLAPLAEVSSEPDFYFDLDDFSSATFLSDLHIKPDEVRDGDVAVFGGSGLIEGVVKGDVAILGGNAVISGKVTGDVVVLGGTLELTKTANVMGELFTFGGDVDEALGARVKRAAKIGSIHRIALFWWFALTLFVLALFGRQVENASSFMAADALKCILTGFLFHIAALMITLLLTVTLIGIPLALVTVIFWFAVAVFGAPVAFVTVGKFIVQRLGVSNAHILLPGFLGFAVLFACRYLPFGGGFLIWHLWAMTGIGAIILTKFGLMRPWFK